MIGHILKRSKYTFNLKRVVISIHLFHNLLELDCMLNEKYFAISIHGCLRDK